jgi:hypothetical protein
MIENTETIAKRHHRYAVVEKHEDVADLAEHSDPRRRACRRSGPAPPTLRGTAWPERLAMVSAAG